MQQDRPGGFNMHYTITEESFASLEAISSGAGGTVVWPSLFTLPWWVECWWNAFGTRNGLRLLAVRREGKAVGAAPLLIANGTASFAGGADVCDYFDFAVEPGAETDFCHALLDYFEREGVTGLDLGPLRPDAAARAALPEAARERGWAVSCDPEEVSLEMPLPGEWEEYLPSLTKKQRHEVRRKLKRLEQAGGACFHILPPGEAARRVDLFLELFVMSTDKRAFLTPPREVFFRAVMEAADRRGLLRLGFLELKGRPAAAVLAFRYRDTVFLYNNGYDPDFEGLSAGQLAKVLLIRGSIAAGARRFDFLKGGERYKYHLGGKEVPLARCRGSAE